MFDTLMVLLKEFLEKVDFEKKTTADGQKSMKNYPVRQRINKGLSGTSKLTTSKSKS